MQFAMRIHMFRTRHFIALVLTLVLLACSTEGDPAGNDPTPGVDVGEDIAQGEQDAASDTGTGTDADVMPDPEDVALVDTDTTSDTGDDGDTRDPSDATDTEDTPDTQDADTGDSQPCPDSNDPEVYYVSTSVAECGVILFGCHPAQVLFTNECGCGCVGPAQGTDNSCGGFSGDTCAVDEYCLYPANDETDCLSNGIGTCTVRPDVCQDVIDPVCACDGQTYDNPCLARAARADVYAPGPCQLL